MTLALYGKSRRRQGGLLLAGVVAVLVAMLAGVATFTAAFAHHNTYNASRQCNGSWSASASYVGGREERLIVLSDVVVNGDAFATSGWNTQSPLSFSSTVPSGVTFASGQAPSGSSLYYWKGTYDGTRTIFSRSGGAGTFQSGSSNWGGSIMLYVKDGGSWTKAASKGGDTDNVTQPSAPTDCATIIIKKVVTGQGSDANQLFTANVDNTDGSEGDATGLSFSQSSPYTHTFGGHDGSGPSQDDFEIVETPLPGAYKLTGKKVLNGDATCPSATSNDWDSNVSGSNAKVTINNLGFTTKTVCFRNELQSGYIQVHKYLPKDPQPQSGQAPWQNQGVGQGAWTFTVYPSLADAQAGTNALASFNQLGPNSPALPQTDLWIKETGLPATQSFYGWFIPDGDNSSGNDKCSQAPLNFQSGNGYSTDPILHLPASYWQTKGNQPGLFHICAYNKPRVYDPGIQKVAADPSYSGGYAQWLIKVDNTANTQAVDVKIQDTNVVNNGAVSGGTCSDGDISDGEMLCSVSAGATLVVPVKRAVSQQCQAGEASNSATISWKAPGSNEYTSLGTVGPVVVAIPANTDLCDKPGITKVANTTSTSDPSAVKWTVTVTNPAVGSQGPGVTQTVYIKDTGVNVVSGPAYTGSASCTIPGGSSFEQELTSANGVQCSMPNNSTISFEVKPAGELARTCEDQKFNNTAYLYIGSTTNTPLTAQGGEITLQGDPELCRRNLEICKVVVGNGDLSVRSGEFNFDVRENGVTTINGIGGLNAGEPNPDSNPGTNGTKVCKTVQVATDKSISVAEWSSRPANWGSDAAGYPKYSINGGAQVSNNTTTNVAAGSSDLNITFYNKAALPTKNVTFQKYICNSLGDVAKNEGSAGVDQVGMPSISAAGGLSGQLNQTDGPVGGGTAVTPSNDGRGNCHLWGSDLTKYPEETGTWDMVIYDTSRSNLLQTVNIPQGGTTSVQLLDTVLLEALKANSNGARVEEVFKTGYGFASLKCYTDHKNQDNWEWLDFNPGGIPSGEVYCIAYNVKATKQITIEKRFVGLPDGYTTAAGDVPGFTLNPSANTSCDAPVKVNNTTWTVTCTVPYSWNGTVTETPPAGWEQTQCAVAAQTTGENPRFTFCNRPVGTVVIVKYENVPPATPQNWTFNGTLPGAPQALSTTGTTNATGTASVTLTNVPAGSYTLAELEGRGQCESGTTSSDYQTRGLTGSSLPSAIDVNGAPIIGANALNVTVGKGTTTYVAFGNQGCGTVLSAANLQVIKYSDPLANFTGTTELGGWTISITGTAGAATGFNASEDTVAGTGAFFLGIPDGTYTVCETAKAGWAVVGSKYNLVNQAGTCRTGVVVNLDQTVVVNFYNQPRVNIEVNKTEISLATPSGGPGSGWSFTLSGCGITPQVKATGADGKATFTDLPPAVGCSYTVTETVKSGWSAINPVQVTAPTAAGQTAVLNFTNVKIEVCTNCVTIVTPTPTPPTPTATPKPSETPEKPTATPETPTQKPTEEATAGARTPGPGQTPIAPSTGNGLLGSGPAGVNMLLALVGLLALSLGTTILALGRKSSRR